MTSLKVVTYNMGSSIADFNAECKFLGQNIDQVDIAQHHTAYTAAQISTANSLVNRASVFCLQEVRSENRPLIEIFKENGYSFFHVVNNELSPAKVRSRDYFDAAIAIKTDEFDDIQNSSILLDNSETAIVTATHKLTRERITFASAHVIGVTLDDGRVHKADADDGDNLCQNIINTISGIESNILIVGNDMNANPEKMDAGQSPQQKWTHRFDSFTKAQFQTHRTNSPTNVNPRSITYPERELDFIFSRRVGEEPTTLPLWYTKFRSFFRKSLGFFAGKTIRLLAWNSKINASDHLPVLTKFRFEKKSTLSRIGKFINKNFFFTDEEKKLIFPCKSARVNMDRIW